MKNTNKSYVSKSKLLKNGMIILSILMIFNVFTSISFNFSYYDSSYENMYLDFENITNTIEEQMNYVNFRIAEVSKWITRDLEERIDDPNFNDIEMNRILTNSTQYMMNELVSYVETGMILYLNPPPLRNGYDINETVILIKKIDALRDTTSIALRYGPPELAQTLDLEYSSRELFEYDVENSEFYNIMKNAVDKTNKTSTDSSMNYWSRLEQGNNPSLYASICSTPIFLNGKMHGVLTFSFVDTLFTGLLIPKSTNFDAVRLFFVSGDGSTFNLDGSPSLSKTINEGFLSGKFEIKKTKVGDVNTYVQGEKIFYGYDKLYNLYPKNSIYGHSSNYILLLAEKTPTNSNILKAILAIFMIILTTIVLYLDRRMSIFDKIFNEEDLDNYEAVNIQELMINASRGNAANADRGDTSKYDRFINSIETLTPMESQVFELYCKDFSPKEVADELKISINTVKSHNRKIYEKLGAANKAELQSLIRMMKDSN